MRGPDWEGFGREIMDAVEWPANSDIEAADLFDMALKHGLIREIDGGYNPEEHVDAYGICPETGDPWYDFNFATDKAREDK